MSKRTRTTYRCDNELTCSSEEISGHGLPVGWFAVTYAAGGEVVEISWQMAQDANWTGYTEGVRIWRIE